MKFHQNALVLLSCLSVATAFVAPSVTTSRRKNGAICQDVALPKTLPFARNVAPWRQNMALAAAEGEVIETTAVEEAATPTKEGGGETFEFQAEVGKVMDIIINSLYSDRDIFLRELISNAADACDKKRFLNEKNKVESQQAINIRCFPEENKIVIEDSGVGMTKDELKNNLGRIAQSGTKAFVQALGDSRKRASEDGEDDVTLIGQFGVGFYSAFLVAQRVEVISKSMDPEAKQYKWQSEASSSFTITEDDSELLGDSGTRIVLHLKDDASAYLEFTKMEDLVKRYSEFIEIPISLWKEKTEYKKVPDEKANANLKPGEEPKTKTIPETTEGFEQINNQKPIWLRAPRHVKEEEYLEFYQNSFKQAYDKPLTYAHFVMEGAIECRTILYIPSVLPYDLARDMFDEKTRNIRLYVKRVFINDKFEGLMPRWLKFIRGVVDSDDLPLNVSREILQRSRVLTIINRGLVRRCLQLLNKLADDEDKAKYETFWNNFGKYLKVGVIEDFENKDQIAPLLRFYTSKSGDGVRSLDEYVKDMPKDQKAIYYITSEGREKASLSPVLEKLSSRGYEVLFATEPLDEIMMESLSRYEDNQVLDASKERTLSDIDDTEEDKKKAELTDTLKETIDYLETVLSQKIQKVKVSNLLVDSPAALIQGAYGVSPTMQRYMKAQTVATGMDLGMQGANQAILEINPNHSIVKDLTGRIAQAKEAQTTEDYARLLYDVAAMKSGYEIEDTGGFAARIMTMMTGGKESFSAPKVTADGQGDEAGSDESSAP